MKLRKITLRKENGEIIKFLPENIQNIIFEKDIVILQYWQEPNPIQTTKIILKKEDYYYPHWEYLILQLISIFEIERY